MSHKKYYNDLTKKVQFLNRIVIRRFSITVTVNTHLRMNLTFNKEEFIAYKLSQIQIINVLHNLNMFYNLVSIYLINCSYF